MAIVSQGGDGDFAGGNAVEGDRIVGGGLGDAEKMLGLFEDLGNVEAMIEGHGGCRFGETQGNGIIDGDHVASSPAERGFGKGGKEKIAS